MKRFILENFHEELEDRELLDTTTGDANPRSRFSQENLAKEKYYPKGIAFLQKKDLCHSERSIKNQVLRHKKFEIPDMADRYFDGGSKNACPHFDALESWIS